MRGFLPLFLGITGTFFFSWVGLTMVPNAQIGKLEPQADEEGTDVYPIARSGMAERGRQVYIANGCVYCHSQQVRPDYAASDIERKWGQRRSAPRDYIYDRPVLLGKMRMGPDLSNVGRRAPAEDAAAPPPGATDAATAAQPPPAPAGATSAPATAAPEAPGAAASPAVPPAAVAGASPAPATAAATAEGGAPPTTTSVGGEPLQYTAAWHHRHLYAPRSVTFDSTMPAFRFLYHKRKIGGEVSANAVQLPATIAPPEDYEIVPSYDAECLVAYLMSLDQSHPLKEVKSVTPPSPPA
ncbi:MAG TPA: cbb3-type cytochrome c oxidase subunit II, partial [Chthoniobacterales bacterium]|nr:cbb3-type cytochrome c oxidase subunit II [Chthoniobacterales bacterium]